MADSKISLLPVAGSITNAELLAIVQSGVTVQTTLGAVLAPYLTIASASAAYQPLDADLTAIAALTGSNGFLKTNGSGTWTVDTNTYLTTASAASTYLALAGGTMVGNINGTTPTEITYLSGATSNIQTQINNLASGLSWKVAVRVATTANITLSGTQTIDGIAVIAGDRVLVKNQSTAANNGIYVCSAGAWSRSTDATTGGTGSTGILGATVVIEEGTVNADTIYICSTDAPITIGVTSLAFTKTSATTYTGSNGITLASNNFTLDNSYFSGAFTLSGGVATIGAGYVTNSMLTNSSTTINGTSISLGASGTVTAAAGTLTGTTLNATVVTSSLTSVGTLTSGVWNASVIGSAYGGTGIANNAASTITISGNFATTFTVTATTGVTLPTSGTLYGTLAASITSAQLLASLTNPTGTGVAVFGTSPTFTTQIITPVIYGSSASGGTLLIDSTSHATKGAMTFGTAGTSNVYNFNTGSGTTLVSIQGQVGSLARPAIYLNQTAPDTTNFALSGNSTTDTYLNGKSAARILVNGGIVSSYFATQITFAVNAAAGVLVNYQFTVPNNTALTASSEVPIFKIIGGQNTWPAGNITTQRFVYFSSNTAVFSSASTFTDVAGFSADAPIMGNFATGTNVHSIYVKSVAITTGSGAATNSFGLTVNANSGATNNYAAQYLGGTVIYAAGTTGYAPLRLISGTNKTTAAAGEFEYNGTNLFFTRTGTTRESVWCGNDAAAAPATNNIGVILDYYGTSATRVLTTPNSWGSVVVGGTTYKIPLYT